MLLFCFTFSKNENCSIVQINNCLKSNDLWVVKDFRGCFCKVKILLLRSLICVILIRFFQAYHQPSWSVWKAISMWKLSPSRIVFMHVHMWLRVQVSWCTLHSSARERYFLYFRTNSTHDTVTYLNVNHLALNFCHMYFYTESCKELYLLNPSCICLFFFTGAYLLNVMWSDKQVPGSPFKVSVLPSGDSSKVVCIGDGLTTGILGREINAIVDTRKAGLG